MGRGAGVGVEGPRAGSGEEEEVKTVRGGDLGEATQRLTSPTCISTPLRSQTVFIDGIIAGALRAARFRHRGLAGGGGEAWSHLLRGAAPPSFSLSPSEASS